MFSFLATITLVTAQLQHPVAIDGDTIRIERRRIRLACIDAPELGQNWGQPSRNFLQNLLNQPGVMRIHPLGRDQYGRTVAIVTKNQRNLAVDLVANGMAFLHPRFINTCPEPMRFQLQHAEQQARTQRLHIWFDPHPQFPWHYR